MIILSLNSHGVGSSPKMLSIKCIFKKFSPKVLFIQETMCSGSKAESVFNSWLKGWNCFSLDVEGKSGGLLKACILHLKVIEVKKHPSCIMVHIFDNKLEIDFKI
jgi:hypothetical protein